MLMGMMTDGRAECSLTNLARDAEEKKSLDTVHKTV